MTVIAFDGATLAIDSIVISGALKQAGVKWLLSEDEERLYLACGDLCLFPYVVQQIEETAATGEFPALVNLQKVPPDPDPGGGVRIGVVAYNARTKELCEYEDGAKCLMASTGLMTFGNSTAAAATKAFLVEGYSARDAITRAAGLVTNIMVPAQSFSAGADGKIKHHKE